jgi:hypothetical protein
VPAKMNRPITSGLLVVFIRNLLLVCCFASLYMNVKAD